MRRITIINLINACSTGKRLPQRRKCVSDAIDGLGRMRVVGATPMEGNRAICFINHPGACGAAQEGQQHRDTRSSGSRGPSTQVYLALLPQGADVFSFLSFVITRLANQTSLRLRLTCPNIKSSPCLWERSTRSTPARRSRKSTRYPLFSMVFHANACRIPACADTELGRLPPARSLPVSSRPSRRATVTW